MREVKFKGKAIMSVDELDEMNFDHNNGWIEGNLIQNDNKPWIVGNVVDSDWGYIAFDYWFRVHPESVGQFTGKKDKNGTKIFEKDVFSLVTKWKYDTDLDQVVAVEEKAHVVWNNKISVYEVEAIGESRYGTGFPLGIINDEPSVKVIGNTYDNPELLEGAK